MVKQTRLLISNNELKLSWISKVLMSLFTEYIDKRENSLENGGMGSGEDIGM